MPTQAVYPYDDQAVLEVNIPALQHNYTSIRALAPQSELAAVIKADAYGMGAQRIAPALFRVGCRAFFVATMQEAQILLPILESLGDDVHIAILSGIFAGQCGYFDCPTLRPVLNTPEQCRLWRQWAKTQPAYIHVDTGMNRLGIRHDEWRDIRLLIDFPVHCIISHLVDADNPQQTSSNQQNKKLQEIQNFNFSLANSAGCFLGSEFAVQQRRIGLSLYGVPPITDTPSPTLQSALSLRAPILQYRTIQTGETVGYAHAYVAIRDHAVLTLGIGYNDGLPRSLTCDNQLHDFHAFWQGKPLPFIGRISMDSCTVRNDDFQNRDILAFPYVDLLNSRQNISDLAWASGTITHEALTRLGTRLYRRYLDESIS